MFNLAPDCESFFFTGDAEEEPVQVTGYTYNRSSANPSTSRLFHPFMGFMLPPA